MIAIILLIGFIRTIVVLVIIFYAIRLFTRYVMPLLLHKTIRDMQSKMKDQMKEQQRQGRREGEVTLERNPNQKGNNSNRGEYVDFEEVD